jgi:hypothetical protein
LMYLLYADRLGEESSEKVLSIFVFHVRTVETFLSGIQIASGAILSSILRAARAKDRWERKVCAR